MHASPQARKNRPDAGPGPAIAPAPPGREQVQVPVPRQPVQQRGQGHPRACPPGEPYRTPQAAPAARARACQRAACCTAHATCHMPSPAPAPQSLALAHADVNEAGTVIFSTWSVAALGASGASCSMLLPCRTARLDVGHDAALSFACTACRTRADVEPAARAHSMHHMLHHTARAPGQFVAAAAVAVAASAARARAHQPPACLRGPPRVGRRLTSALGRSRGGPKRPQRVRPIIVAHFERALGELVHAGLGRERAFPRGASTQASAPGPVFGVGGRSEKRRPNELRERQWEDQ